MLPRLSSVFDYICPDIIPNLDFRVQPTFITSVVGIISVVSITSVVFMAG